MNILTLSCKATEYNGFPKITVLLDHKVFSEVGISTEQFDILIPLDHTRSKKCLQLHRHGKTDQNVLLDPQGKIIQDQTLEILQIKIDDIAIPNFLIYANSQFEFDNQCHPGSCFIGPNGLWTFKFYTPIIEYILDERILHEAKYNQDYQFDWSYKLGPNSVNTITTKIDSLFEKISNML
jgi:hypothetical protein